MSINSAYTVHFIYEMCVKDVQTVSISITIAKMYSYIANSKKLTVYSFYNGKS